MSDVVASRIDRDNYSLYDFEDGATGRVFKDGKTGKWIWEYVGGGTGGFTMNGVAIKGRDSADDILTSVAGSM